MDLQALVESVDGMATLYAFDIFPDGSFSEIRLMAVNKKNDYMLHFSPNSPKFYPGIPYRSYWMDLNFEKYVYNCGSRTEPLYSYVNARGAWLKGFYIPIKIPDESEMQNGVRTVYCLYIFTYSKTADTCSMALNSPEANEALVKISIKLHENEDFYKGMASAVADIKELCGAKWCAVCTVDKETENCGLINENGQHNEMLEGMAAEMERTPYEVALAWEKDLAQSNCLILENLDIIKERDPAWYYSLSIHNVENLILFVIRYNQNIVGFIWAADFDTSKTMLIKETLELTSFLVAAVIANHQLLSRLEKKSTVDELTQVSNRNAMNDRIDSLISGRAELPANMGVVFADLNGLKNVNDELGHKAGDKLLTKSASLLKIAFGDSEIYRAGGDEFVVLCPDTAEEMFMRQVKQLRSLADSTDDVRFAVGVVYCKGSCNITRAMQTADERMYKDKKAYYRAHPELDKRMHG